jgi:hypothetical protein
MPRRTRASIGRQLRTGEFNFNIIRQGQGEWSHNHSTSATYNNIKLHEDTKYLLQTIPNGVTLVNSELKKRQPHSFRDPKLSLNRILTYMAENMLSHLKPEYTRTIKSGKRVGQTDPIPLSEVQIAWISTLKCLVITENNIEQFGKLIPQSSAGVILKLTTHTGKKLQSQGQKPYFNARIVRHTKKLNELLNLNSDRYRDFVGIDRNIRELINFLKNPDIEVKCMKRDVNNIDEMKNKIIYYDKIFKPPCKQGNMHAELYHLQFCNQIKEAWEKKYPLLQKLRFYIAGTKRACSTCTGELAVNKARLNLIVDDEHPGNLWPGQIRQQSTAGISHTTDNLENHNMFTTKCRDHDAEVAGCNSDSDSDAEESDAEIDSEED